MKEKAEMQSQDFESLYRAHSGMVYNVALRMTSDPGLAEETVQEVFLKVFENLDRFENRSDIKTWIYRITVNTAINLAKKISYEKRRNVALDEKITDNLVGYKDNIESNFEIKERDKKIKKLLDSLPPKYRSYVVLCDLEGLSYEEIAKIMRKNINTVRTRIKRAREKLIKLFGKEADSDGL